MIAPMQAERQKVMEKLCGDYAALNDKERALLRTLLRSLPVVQGAVARGEADEEMAVSAVEALIEMGTVRFVIEETGNTVKVNRLLGLKAEASGVPCGRAGR